LFPENVIGLKSFCVSYIAKEMRVRLTHIAEGHQATYPSLSSACARLGFKNKKQLEKVYIVRRLYPEGYWNEYSEEALKHIGLMNRGGVRECLIQD